MEPQVLPYLGPWAKATPPQEENRAVRTLKPQEKEWRRLQRRKPRPQEEELKNVDEAIGAPMPKSPSPVERERHVLTHIPYAHGALCASRAEDVMIHTVPDDLTLDRSSCSLTTPSRRARRRRTS